MKIPGFTAEESLNRTNWHYQSLAAKSNVSAGQRVIPQMRASGWRIPIGPIVIGPEGTDCIYIDNTKTRTFCIICPTLTSCWQY